MKSVIICEGNTDLTLIQYFLIKVYNWIYIEKNNYKKYKEDGITHPLKTKNQNDIKWLEHNNGSVLCILSSGGVSGIPSMLEQILDLNNIGSVKQFDKIVVISDRDEVNTEVDFIKTLNIKFENYTVKFSSEVLHNCWNVAEYTDLNKNDCNINYLPLIIPFEETGAIETFLLDSISAANEIDKKVIDQCKDFIDNIDCKDNDDTKKYLKHRREQTKAKFNTVFSIMTPAEAFEQRRTLLRSVPWEQYETIQKCFGQLSKLSKD